MVCRVIEKSCAESNRHGFNGKENDRHWAGQLIQDYGFRLYNPAIGKFLSVDPLAPEYPWYTPYQFAGNMPIVAVDLDGLEPKIKILAPLVSFFWGSKTEEEQNMLKARTSYEMREIGRVGILSSGIAMALNFDSKVRKEKHMVDGALRNTVRHTVGQALATRHNDLGADVAKDWADAHEGKRSSILKTGVTAMGLSISETMQTQGYAIMEGHAGVATYDLADAYVDMWNNEIGRKIGSKGDEMNESQTSTVFRVIEEMGKGTLLARYGKWNLDDMPDEMRSKLPSDIRKTMGDNQMIVMPVVISQERIEKAKKVYVNQVAGASSVGEEKIRE